MTTPIIPIILAGGSGTRLWPLSRKNYPKQFLQLQGETSLLQQTMQRVLQFDANQTYIVSNESHYFLCQEQLAEHPSIHYILEPCVRNTAPAIACVAHHLVQTGHENAVMLILPSDHWIADEQAWYEAMLLGTAHASKEAAIVTFGIKPDSPKTGYGYIESKTAKPNQVSAITRFYEKPNMASAKSFLEAQHYFWNSGMFACRASTYLEELNTHEPNIYESSKQALEKARAQHNYIHLEDESFALCEDKSIDYAIMEKTNHAVVIPVDIQWSDLGCWTAVSEARPADENNNNVSGHVVTKDSTGCLISTDNTLVTTLGVHDQIIVATKDAILVADKAYSQDVKELVSTLNQAKNPVTEDHLHVSRPWGHYEVLAEGKTFKVKRLMLKPGAKLSLQMHQHRAEHWVVVSGEAEVVNDDKLMRLSENQSTYIPPKTRHRLSNPGETPLYVIEVQSGEYLGEDDITRFDDVYDHCRIT